MAFPAAAGRPPVRVLLYGGDSMLGRAVNLTLPHQSPGDEQVTDSCTAAHYLELALPREQKDVDELQRVRHDNKDGHRLWGDLLHLELDPPPDLRLLNLETAVTKTITNSDIPLKAINYHMHSSNLVALASLAAARHGASSDVPYVVSFSNNHSLDFGRKALEAESLPQLQALPGQGSLVGIGHDLAQASRPAEVSVRGTDVRIVSFASECSGTPAEWAASESRSGLVWLPALTAAEQVDRAFDICRRTITASGPFSGLLIVSVHWGPNWAYYGGDAQQHRRALAHRLVDELGVALIYGHSSHHIRGMEVHRGKLIVYGAGDLVNDYEGIPSLGGGMFSRLGGAFAVDLAPDSGDVRALRIVPMVVESLALRRVMPGSILREPGQKKPIAIRGAIEELAHKVNELSAADAHMSAVVPNLRVCMDSGPLGVNPPGPILVWP